MVVDRTVPLPYHQSMSYSVISWGRVAEPGEPSLQVAGEVENAWVEVHYKDVPFFEWRGYWLPSDYSVLIEDYDLPYSVRLAMARRGNRPECVEVTLGAQVRRWALLRGPEEGETLADFQRFSLEWNSLTTQGLRRIPLPRLIRLAALVAIHGGSQDKPEPLRIDDWERVYEKETAENARPRQLDDAHYQRVAQVYRRAVDEGVEPVVAVQKELHGSRSTAGRWVMESRKRGFLGKAPAKGRAGEVHD